MKKKSELPFVSIIVLNWNGRRFVDGFFDSIEKLDYPKDCLEVIFVDNGSTDDSVAYFKSKKISYARLVETGANYGYAKGNSFGFRAAKGDYIAVCNNDLELDKNWLKELVASAKRTNADVTVPKLVFADTKTINNAGSMLVPDSDWPNLERGMDAPMDDPEFNKEVEVTAFCGASPLFKKSFLEDVGLFDRRFFLYWEDGDLSWRGQKQGKKYIYAPKSIAYHHTSGSTGGSVSPVFIYHVSRNRVIILIKNARFFYAFKAFAKVGRDHVLFKIRDLWHAIRSGHGRKQALANLRLGLKIIFGIIALTPISLMKRWHIVKEETL